MKLYQKQKVQESKLDGQISALKYGCKDTNEIDIVIEINGKFHPLEMKKTNSG